MLREYFAEYERLAEIDPTVLNRKVPRDAFAGLLEQVGGLLLDESRRLAQEPGPVREFLDTNPLPRSLEGRLPDEFRTFALLLNSLKQWVNAEQAATDRYLLGGNARTACRAAATECIVSRVPLAGASVELHHPVRDGRPPIPVSKEAHATLEGQVAGETRTHRASALADLKRQGNNSWAQLRRGCMELLGVPVTHSTPQVRATSLSFARKASRVTGLTYETILGYLDEQRLGI